MPRLGCAGQWQGCRRRRSRLKDRLSGGEFLETATRGDDRRGPSGERDNVQSPLGEECGRLTGFPSISGAGSLDEVAGAAMTSP
jgi:hypothetical protein